MSTHSNEFTNQEAVTAVLRITRGNIRLLDRLMRQVEHVLVVNQLQVMTKEVVETARKNLIIGFDCAQITKQVSISASVESSQNRWFLATHLNRHEN